MAGCLDAGCPGKQYSRIFHVVREPRDALDAQIGQGEEPPTALLHGLAERIDPVGHVTVAGEAVILAQALTD